MPPSRRVKKGSNTRSSTPAGMPGPSSSTRTAKPCLSSVLTMRIQPPSGTCWIALMIRLRNTWIICSRSQARIDCRALSRVSIRMFFFSARLPIRARTCSMISCTSWGWNSGGRGDAHSSSVVTSRFSRSVSLTMKPVSSRSCSVRSPRRSSIWADDLRMPSGVRTSCAMIAAISPTTASLPARTRCSRDCSRASIISAKAWLSSPTSLMPVCSTGGRLALPRRKFRANSVSRPMGEASRLARRLDNQPATARLNSRPPMITQARCQTGAKATRVGSTTRMRQPNPEKC